MDPRDDADEEIDPREAARMRRRDRDATESERAPMRTGLSKQFKQVLDAQARRAQEAPEARKPRRSSPKP